MKRKIGLIAGMGTFPFLFADEAKKNGCRVIAIAVRGYTREDLVGHVEKVCWIEIGQLRKIFWLCLLNGIRELVMAGKIPKGVVFDRSIKRDGVAEKVLKGSRTRGTATLLTRLADMLKRFGITLLDSTTFLDEHLAPVGPLGTILPPAPVAEDITFGLTVAREIARLDIGQTVIVKDKDIVAVEGVEGTDSAIRRAASLAGEGIVVVKVARPDQDMRFDVPTIGPETLTVLKEARAAAMAVEAKKTLVLEKDVVRDRIREYGIPIVGVI